MTTARHALPDDRDDAIATLADAFSTDPFWVHMLAGGAPAVPLDLMSEAMAIEFDAHVGHGHTYVIDTRAAALWNPPGVHADMDGVSAFFGEHADPQRLEDAIPQFIEMAEWRPEEPHFYLHLVGARSEHRGRGLGSRMLDRVLRTCDAEGVPAYLEASTPQSAVLYARHGFEQLASITFADGVSLLPMLRPSAGEHQS